MISLADLVGGDAQHNAHVAKSLFEGNFRSPIADIVRLNAAAGLVAYELAKNPDGIDRPLVERFEHALNSVTETLEQGKAAQKLSSWMTATQI